MSNVTAIRAPKPALAAPKALSRKVLKRYRRQRLAAVGLGLVAVVLIALSLTHFAHGIAIVTGSSTWQAWAMAVGIDLGYVALEIAALSAATDTARAKVAGFIKWSIVGTLVWSAGMNAAAFAEHAQGIWLKSAGAGFGIAVPLLILALTHIASTLYIDGSK